MVTGASGFIGSRIVRRLVREGNHVAAIVESKSPSHLALLERALEGEDTTRVELEVCDLHDRDQAESLVRRLSPGACIHGAWNVTPGVYRDSPDNQRWVETSLDLIELLAGSGCRWFCVLGTCFETADSPERASAYSRAKSALRSAALEVLRGHPDARLCWLRIFQPYGPGEHVARLFPALIEACISGRRFTIRTGRAVRDFIHTDDIARAVGLAYANRVEGEYDVGTGRGRSVLEAAEWIAELMEGRELLEIQPFADDAPEDAIVADPAPLISATGWKPCAEFESAIKLQVSETMTRPDGPAAAGTASCPICGSSDLTPILASVQQPAMLNRLCESQAQAIEWPRVQISFAGCRSCGLVFNSRFDPTTVAYASDYVNDQAHSDVFMIHSQGMRDRLADLIATRPGRIVEIGCGQGGFLRSLCEQTGRDGIGFDPACAGSATSSAGVILKSESFTPEHAGELARDGTATALICCRHVLEHLADPLRMLRAIREIAAPSDALVYLETPSYEWTARRGAFFDFCNEHCSLFTARSMQHALATTGMRAVRITETFGGQYLSVHASIDHGAEAGAPAADAEHPTEFAAVAKHLSSERRRAADLLDDAAAQGPVFVWCAAGKGVSLAAHLGLDRRRVPHFIDVNPLKQGRYIPITGQRVIAPEALPGVLAGIAGRPTIAVTNPNYADEIAGCLESMGVRAEMIVLTEKDPIEAHG